MPDYRASVTYVTYPEPFPQPVPFQLDAAIKKAVAALPTASRGAAEVTATLEGLEASIAYRPRQGLTLGGYAARLWGGGWQAGARARWEF